MKKIILILFLFYSTVSLSQKEQYLLLEQLPQENKYTLNAKKEYKIDKDILLYNYFVPGGGLVLISILPDLYGYSDWEEVSYQFIENKIIHAIILFQQIEKDGKTKFFNRYGAVKKENGKYYIAKNTLIEYFEILDYEIDLGVSGSNVINTKQRIRTYSDVKKNYLNRFNFSPMENSPWDDRATTYIDNKFRFTYLSEIEKKDTYEIYRFWTFDDWYKPYKESENTENYNYHRGIDRFAYIKGKGIVGGSYDFYFNRWLSDGFFRAVGKNIMWAKELFPEQK